MRRIHFIDLQKKLAELECINDQLATEIRYTDKLLRSIGFQMGLATVKESAEELIEREQTLDE